MKHTLSVLVEDESGALSRISGLFARRGFNIDSLAVGPAESKGISRLTMVVEGDDETLQQMTKQLNKLFNVLGVVDFTNLAAVERELMLLKVSSKEDTRSNILDIVQIFRAKVVDVSDMALTLEVVGDPGKLVALEKLLEPYGILEIARTGKVALKRSSGVNTEMLKINKYSLEILLDIWTAFMKSSLLIFLSTSNPLIIFPKIEYLPSSSGIFLVTKKNSVEEDLFLPRLTIAIDPL